MRRTSTLPEGERLGCREAGACATWWSSWSHEGGDGDLGWSSGSYEDAGGGTSGPLESCAWQGHTVPGACAQQRADSSVHFHGLSVST